MSSSQRPPKAALVAALIAAAATASYVASALAKSKRTAGLKKLSLLPVESSPILREAQPISTITFFTGDHRQAEKQLALKVAEILRLNPWLDSVLEEDRGGGLAAYYPVGKRKTFSVRGDVEVRRVVSSTGIKECE